jgi:phospholipid N-methyltransferase
MEFKFIIRIKAEHNPPVFKEELGKGVVATQVIDYKVTEEDLSSPTFALNIIEQADELLNEYFEVKIVRVDQPDTKKLILLLVDGKVKGIVTSLPTCTKWWHFTREIDVPLVDWQTDKVRIDTIQKYM